MKKYRVLWGDVAENDLIGIIEFIAIGDPVTAKRIFKRIRGKASALAGFPEKGRVVPELREQGITAYRELIVSPWRIIYKTDNDRVLVFAVLDACRNIEDILLNRLVGVG
jgi:toxin ParE1/3/4